MLLADFTMKKNKNENGHKPKAKSEQEVSNPFKVAVENTADIASGYHVGLKAMGNYSTKVQVVDAKQLGGSVDIDGMTKDKYPQDARWDYVVGYQRQAYFIEVHSAETSEVKTVLAKLKWLKDWLKTQAPGLVKIQSPVDTFVWIPSGRTSILPNSPQAMRLNQSGLKLVPVLRLKAGKTG